MEKIYYADIETPIGTIWAVQSLKGIMRLNFPCEESELLSYISRFSDTEPEYRPSKLDDLEAWLRKYFQSENIQFSGKFDLRGTSFQKRVWKTLFKLSYGKLISYGKLAENIGKPKAARAVGNAVGENPVAIVIPCHRVIRGNGSIGGFGGGLPIKRILLTVEGILDSSYGVPEKGIDLRKFF
jgi:O-6-methylguanine DNA methyltransferase